MRSSQQAGYAMAALIVALTVMAIMMTVVMPVWKQAAQREKEEELVFRGQQYVHALALFARKYANAAPPNVNMLVEQRFLRKKYKDPITNDDFQPILFGQNLPGAGAPTSARPGQPATNPPPSAGGRQTAPVSTTPSTGFPGAGGRGTATPGTQGGATAGIVGVTSKSKDKSLRLYNGRNHYNEWAFVYTQQNQAPGVGAPGTAQPGQRGQPGQPGGPGVGPGGRGDGRGRGFGRGVPPGPGRGIGGGVNPLQPPQPIFQPGRGRSGG